MRSHDLARALLAHRDNDVKVVVIYDNDPNLVGTPDVFYADRVDVHGVRYDTTLDHVVVAVSPLYGPAWEPSPVPCVDGCSDPQRHAEGGHDV